METTMVKGEEAYSYTVEEFIRATRPDGLGHVYVDDIHCGAFREVLCDCCGDEIVQPEDNAQETVVFTIPGFAWCKKCFGWWVEGSR
jgi:hypothetical protein